jgi:hypothetical protein
VAAKERRGLTMSGHIRLQVSTGDFDPEFMRELPGLEKTMIEHGLDPAAFVIAKSDALVTRLPIAYRPNGHPTEYTVFVKGRSFTVTQSDDLSFLAYFYRLYALRPAEKDDPHSVAHKLHSGEQKLAAVIGRLEN